MYSYTSGVWADWKHICLLHVQRTGSSFQTPGKSSVNLDNDVSGVHLHLCANNSRHRPSCHHTQWRCSHGIAQVYKEYCDVDDDDTYIYMTKKQLATSFWFVRLQKSSECFADQPAGTLLLSKLQVLQRL